MNSVKSRFRDDSERREYEYLKLQLYGFSKKKLVKRKDPYKKMKLFE